jgi:hypothetical protein
VSTGAQGAAGAALDFPAASEGQAASEAAFDPSGHSMLPAADGEGLGLDGEGLGLDGEGVGGDGEGLGVDGEGLGLDGEGLGLDGEGLGLPPDACGDGLAAGASRGDAATVRTWPDGFGVTTVSVVCGGADVAGGGPGVLPPTTVPTGGGLAVTST